MALLGYANQRRENSKFHMKNEENEKNEILNGMHK